MKLKEKKSKFKNLKELFKSFLGNTLSRKIIIEKDGITYRKYFLNLISLHSLYIEFNIGSEDFPSQQKQKLGISRIYWKDVFEDTESNFTENEILYIAIRKADSSFILQYNIFDIGDLLK